MNKFLLLLVFLLGQMMVMAQSQSETGVISAKDVRIRTVPNSKGKVIAKADLGDYVHILDRTDEAYEIKGVYVNESDPYDACTKFPWYKVRVNGKTGWIYGALVFEQQSSKMIKNSGGKRISWAQARGRGGDMCYGANFLFIIDGRGKVRLLKGFSGGGEHYRAMPGVGFDMNIMDVEEKSGGKIILTTGGSAPGDYEEERKVELTLRSDGDYSVRQIYFKTNE